MSARERLDVLVVDRGFAESREQAQRLIQAGQVRVDGHPATKSGHRFDRSVAIEVSRPPRFVSRGGDKLEAAFQAFGLDVAGMTCLDVGASTGGFTDCLLQHGADHVYAVDVGRGQLHWKLRNDPRVTVYEGINARHLQGGALPGNVPFCVVDVSFISLTLVLPAVIRVLTGGAQLVTLVKPQFEAGREQVGKGGVVRDAAVHAAVLQKVRTFGEQELGLQWLDLCESPVRGPAGNVEFLVWWRRNE
jgi:23S rRNA (cytidine1920-2'-O)/16S rRNA (cytidine1409-2'-O)-methyltransferase